MKKMNRFKQLTEMSRFVTIVLCATLVLASCDKKDKQETVVKSGTAGNLIWKITDDGTLTINGTGEIPNYGFDLNYDYHYAPWYEYRSSIYALVIENGVTFIGNCAFLDCSNLTSVTIPNSITSIGHSAFNNCSDLTTVTIPNSVTDIGDYGFQNCCGLISVTIPNSVTNIGYCAFLNCSGLMSIIVDVANNAFCSENGILFNKAKTTLIQYPARKIGAYIISNSVTSIGNGAFAHCSGLTSVTIPNSVTYIGMGAFFCCSGLTSLIIPNLVTSIESEAFRYCNDLVSVTIGNSVTRISYYAFANCSSITEVISQGTTPPMVSTYAPSFDGINVAACTLRVPEASIDAYKAATSWGVFGNIVAIE